MLIRIVNLADETSADHDLGGTYLVEGVQFFRTTLYTSCRNVMIHPFDL